MYKLPTKSAKPGMVTYEDIYNQSRELLFKANTRLTQDNVDFLCEQQVNELILAGPNEVDMPRYMHLQTNPHFQRFNAQYMLSLSTFTNLIRTLDTGIQLNLSKFLSLRDDLMDVVMTGEQFLDYLYNMMPDEHEITYNHCFNCGMMCYIFGTWIELKEQDLDNLTLAGFLFDVGKTKISEDILWKPDKLTPEEYIQMQHHIHLGYELLKRRELPPHVISVMIMHHERCDGSGYPARITEDRIDPFALIAAIADTYEAMTHPRAQRVALTPFQAIRTFEQQGLEAKYGKYIKPILTRIANMYLGRRVCVTGNLEGRITEIHEEFLSHPTVFINNVASDLRTKQNAEILRML